MESIFNLIKRLEIFNQKVVLRFPKKDTFRYKIRYFGVVTIDCIEHLIL